MRWLLLLAVLLSGCAARHLPVNAPATIPAEWTESIHCGAGQGYPACGRWGCPTGYWYAKGTRNAGIEDFGYKGVKCERRTR